MYMLPGMVLFGLFDANRLLLNCFGETTVATSLVIVCLPMHALLSYYFVHVIGMGWPGVNLSMFLSYAFLLVAITIFSSITKNEEVRKAWVLPNRESFKDWLEIIKLAIPGIWLFMVESAACEGLILFSGFIGMAE
jgi:Na+-driven multidrug efflux pump